MERIINMGDAFRGLWHIRERQFNGEIKHGWACTVFHQGDIVDTQTFEDIESAIGEAEIILSK